MTIVTHVRIKEGHEPTWDATMRERIAAAKQHPGFVGDCGDVVDTATRRVVKRLEPLANTRKFIEVEFDARGRVAWVPPFRSSVGQVT